MSARPTTVCVLACALALSAGCGGGDETEDAEQVVRDFVTALNERDGRAFCTRIATREYVEKVTVAEGEGAVEQCRRQIEQVRQPRYELVRMVRTAVDGDRATVTADLDQGGRARRQVFHLVKEGGGFRLTSQAPR